jgi:hypothetical protein
LTLFFSKKDYKEREIKGHYKEAWEILAPTWKLRGRGQRPAGVKGIKDCRREGN